MSSGALDLLAGEARRDAAAVVAELAALYRLLVAPRSRRSRWGSVGRWR